MTIDLPRTGQIPGLRRLWQTAFHDSDDFLDSFFSVGFAPERCRCLCIGDTVAATLYWFDCRWNGKKVAYLYAVATDPARQGQGLCRKLMADTHDHLRKQGYQGAILVPGDASLFFLYEKLGYLPCCKVSEQTVTAGGSAVPFCQIYADRFASVQKKYLPEDSVFHGAKALDFAATFNRFYEGTDFVFCGAPDKDTFFFQSFLGNIGALPGILIALGMKKGIVRLPGSQHFAMYHNLDGDASLPRFFEIPLN